MSVCVPACKHVDIMTTANDVSSTHNMSAIEDSSMRMVTYPLVQ